MTLKANHIFYILLLFTIVGKAQDFAKDYKIISERMQKTKQFHAKTKVQVFNGRAEPVVVRTSEIKQKGKKVWIKSEGMLALYTPEHIVAVVERNKLISYSKGVEGASKNALNTSMMLNDSIIALFDSVQFIPLSNNEKKYTLYLSNGMFLQISIVLTKELTYKSMEYVYNQAIYNNQSHAHIDFITWNETAQISDAVYSINKILVKKNNKWTPSSKYIGFQVIDNTIKK